MSSPRQSLRVDTTLDPTTSSPASPQRVYSPNNPFYSAVTGNYSNDGDVESLSADVSQLQLSTNAGENMERVQDTTSVPDTPVSTTSEIPSIHVIDSNGIETDTVQSPTSLNTPPALPPFPPRNCFHTSLLNGVPTRRYSETVVQNQSSEEMETPSQQDSQTDSQPEPDATQPALASTEQVANDTTSAPNSELYGSQTITLTPNQLRAQIAEEDRILIASLPPSPNYTALPSPGELSIPNHEAIDPVTINDNPPDEEPPEYTEMSSDVAQYVMRPHFSATGGDSPTGSSQSILAHPPLPARRYSRPPGTPPRPPRPSQVHHAPQPPQRPSQSPQPPQRPSRPQIPPRPSPSSPNSPASNFIRPAGPPPSQMYSRPLAPPPSHGYNRPVSPPPTPARVSDQHDYYRPPAALPSGSGEFVSNAEYRR